MAMKKFDSMNLVPFIDIMLVLLVIVLTTASFIHTSRIQVNVPKVSDGERSNENTPKKPVNITIDSEGKYYIDNDNVSLEELRKALRSYEKDTPIIINGDSKSNLDSFVQVMDTLQAQGLKELYIVVEEEK